MTTEAAKTGVWRVWWRSLRKSDRDVQAIKDLYLKKQRYIQSVISENRAQNKLAMRLEEDGKGNNQLLWNMLRKKRKLTKGTAKMKSGDRKLTEKPEEIKKLWEEYFDKLLKKGFMEDRF